MAASVCSSSLQHQRVPDIRPVSAGHVRPLGRSARHGGRWARGLAINGIGLVVTASILAALCSIKFFEGGWVTLLATAGVVTAAWGVRRHYAGVARRLQRLDDALALIESDPHPAKFPRPEPGRAARPSSWRTATTASAYTVPERLPRCSRTRSTGACSSWSARSMRGRSRGRTRWTACGETARRGRRYADLARRYGLDAQVKTDIGPDVMATVQALVADALRGHPGAVVFAGQLAFPTETVWTRWLHNYVALAPAADLLPPGRAVRHRAGAVD